jgi:hypothetical protein
MNYIILKLITDIKELAKANTPKEAKEIAKAYIENGGALNLIVCRVNDENKREFLFAV